MVDRQASRKQIEEFALNGWDFRVKPRKNKKYVSRRKGPQEKGLGRYTDEYWEMIQDVKRSLTEAKEKSMQTQTETKETIHPLLIAWEELEQNMKIYLNFRCLYLEHDRFCGYWLLEDLPRHGKQLDQTILEDYFRKVNSVDGKTQAWAFKPTKGVCSSCPSFTVGKSGRSSQFPLVHGRKRSIMPIYIA